MANISGSQDQDLNVLDSRDVFNVVAYSIISTGNISWSGKTQVNSWILCIFIFNDFLYSMSFCSRICVIIDTGHFLRKISIWAFWISIINKNPERNISAHANGGPRNRVCARWTLCLALHWHDQKLFDCNYQRPSWLGLITSLSKSPTSPLFDQVSHSPLSLWQLCFLFFHFEWFFCFDILTVSTSFCSCNDNTFLFS